MVGDIWHSLMALPVPVRLWVFAVLVPVNAASLAFMHHAGMTLVVLLALAGMGLNVPLLLVERGFSRAMAFPHLLCWVPMLAIVMVMLWRGVGQPALAGWLWLLLAVDLVSLAFDLRDARSWLRGDRAVAGREPDLGATRPK